MSELLPVTHPAATSHACGEASLAPLPQAGGVGGGHERFSIFSPQAQGAFLQSLQINGNVRLACKAARVSAQTAYRARRSNPALARAWDAACLAARDHAEQVLADRAINGVEEAVFYHGEEVARRTRYSDRLLLAHLARLDRLAERVEVSAALAQLDDQIEALQRGEELDSSLFVLRQAQHERGRANDTAQHEPAAENLSQDSVPCVPSGRVSSTPTPAPEPCAQCGGLCNGPEHALTQADCQWFGNRLNRMWDARPHGVPAPHEQGDTDGFIEELQIEAFEADLPEWWLITSEEALDAALDAALEAAAHAP